jgi:hypothetical protein
MEKFLSSYNICQLCDNSCNVSYGWVNKIFSILECFQIRSLSLRMNDNTRKYIVTQNSPNSSKVTQR